MKTRRRSIAPCSPFAFPASFRRTPPPARRPSSRASSRRIVLSAGLPGDQIRRRQPTSPCDATSTSRAALSCGLHRALLKVTTAPKQDRLASSTTSARTSAHRSHHRRYGHVRRGHIAAGCRAPSASYERVCEGITRPVRGRESTGGGTADGPLIEPRAPFAPPPPLQPTSPQEKGRQQSVQEKQPQESVQQQLRHEQQQEQHAQQRHSRAAETLGPKRK
eukprot:358252-Chlamydomonas_euryale.AAC.4